MTFPANWPPPVGANRFSLRFYVTDTATANFVDKAYNFADGGTVVHAIKPYPTVDPGEAPDVFTLPVSSDVVPAPPFGTPTAFLWASSIRICNDGGGTLSYSFDGVNVHGTLKANEQVIYRNRHEAGIAVKGASAVFRIEAW